MVKQGLVQGLLVGVAALVITTIIAFIIVSNVATVDDDIAAAITGDKVTNETGAFVNTTGYTLAQASSKDGFTNPAITAVWVNVSLTPYLIPATNYSVTTAGVLTNASIVPNATEYNDATVSYTYEYTPTITSANRLIGNLSTGVDNVSSKIPTVLLIAVVVLVLGVLVLLWKQYAAGGMGSEGSL